MAQFVPRGSFPQHTAIARSYYLGHHRAGLRTMKSMLSSIDYVVECRDYRVPVTSINPMFEEALGNKQRVIVYTKKDLGNSDQSLSQKLVSCFVAKVRQNLTCHFRQSVNCEASIHRALFSSLAPAPREVPTILSTTSGKLPRPLIG